MEMWGKNFFDPHFELHIRQAWCTHSMARANLNKSKFFLTSTTKASKYIPKRSRICINWNPSFQIQIYLVNVPLSMNIVKQDLLNNKIVYENFMKCGLKEGISIDGDSWPLRYVIWWRCGSRSQKELTLIQISDIRQKSWVRNVVGIWNPGGGGLIVIYCLIQIPPLKMSLRGPMILEFGCDWTIFNYIERLKSETCYRKKGIHIIFFFREIQVLSQP